MARRSRSRTEGLLRFLQTRGVQRGVFGSSRTWFWIAIATWVLRRVRKVIGSEPELVYRGEIKPGQAIRIDHRTEVYGTTKR
ncbi:MAG TPA: hypothetical protein VIL36_14410 [Acidimicrobiales bacterium]